METAGFTWQPWMWMLLVTMLGVLALGFLALRRGSGVSFLEGSLRRIEGYEQRQAAADEAAVQLLGRASTPAPAPIPVPAPVATPSGNGGAAPHTGIPAAVGQGMGQRIDALQAQVAQLVAERQQKPRNPILEVYQKLMDQTMERTEVVGVQLGLTMVKLDQQEMQFEVRANRGQIRRNGRVLFPSGGEEEEWDELQRLAEHRAERPANEGRRPDEGIGAATTEDAAGTAAQQANGNGDVPPAPEPVTLR